MFKQLSYFHTLAEDISDLAKSSQKLNQILADAYSPQDQLLCTVQAQIDSIIQEEQLLQNTLASLNLQVATNTFVPERLDELQIKEIQPFQATLPTWLPFVLDEQYSSRRQDLNNYALELFKMHNLDEKRKALSRQREDLMTLQVRSAQMGQKGFQGIDLLTEATHFRDRMKHVRKSYQFFCSQVAKKVVQFVRQLIEKGKNFHQNSPRAGGGEFSHRHEVKKEIPPFIGDVLKQFRQVEPPFRQVKVTYEPEQYYGSQYFRNKAKIDKVQPAQNIRRPLYAYSPVQQVHYSPIQQSHQHYYLRSKNIRSESPKVDLYRQQQLRQQQLKYYGQAVWKSPPNNQCYHHHSSCSKSPAHTHTCISNENKLTRVNQSQAKATQVLRSSRKYDYRNVLNDYYN